MWSLLLTRLTRAKSDIKRSSQRFHQNRQMFKNRKSSAYDSSLALSVPGICSWLSEDVYQFPLPCTHDHWNHLLQLVEKADSNLCDRKKEDLDREFQYALIVLTLLAAVLSDSYKWLTKKAPYSVIARYFFDSRDGEIMATVSRSAATINALWLLSLIFTITSILMSHHGLMWLREFRNQPQFEAKNQLAFRQIRYDSLCRWRLFDVCDLVPLMLPLAMAFWFSGLFVLLWTLHYPEAFAILIACVLLLVYYFFIALHPLYYSLFGRTALSTRSSPFRSPSSWLFFKLGNWLILSTHNLILRRKVPPAWHPKQLHYGLDSNTLPSRAQQVVKSATWLEEDCFHFLHPDNTVIVEFGLACALIWIETNPTIEKTNNVVTSIYHCIKELALPTICERLKLETITPTSGLAKIFFDLSGEYHLNEELARVLVLKLWLELYVDRMPELNVHLAELHIRCMYHYGQNMAYGKFGLDSFKCLGLEEIHRFPLDIVLRMLTMARFGLENRSYYYKGTFNLIRSVMLNYKHRHELCQVRDSMLVILRECKSLADKFQASGFDGQQANLFVQEFLCAFDSDSCASDAIGRYDYSPLRKGEWSDIITLVDEVYFVVQDSPPSYRCEDCCSRSSELFV